MQVGDLVLIVQGNVSHGQRPKGLIEKVFPDKHGHVRQVIVRTATAHMQRDVRKICLLEGTQ